MTTALQGLEIVWGGFGDADVRAMAAILLLPLAAFVIQIFAGKRLPRAGDWLPTLAIGVAFVLALPLFVRAVTAPDPALLLHSGRPPEGSAGFAWNWLWSDPGPGRSNFVFAFLFDNLTAVMLVVVTLVSFLVHLFSVGYMKDDPKYPRFFAYLALFSFSMLGLVLSASFLFLLIFWELVGLSSYLLIGFWFEKPSAADACKKAFLTTRVGDAGMLVGLLMIWWHFKTFDFVEIFEKAAAETAAAGGSAPLWMTVAAVLIFMGPVGKSAQFPLHVWLPDAMEGPTPVSALIHAATMVAAGVYLVGRMFPFFMFVPDAMLVVAVVGAFTALFAATIGITQFDIKKVLAYSTISQLGFMMTALGCGSLAAGLFHLMTHAWFKACLFLGSGSVIHALHHEQDMRRMGGLRRRMPITYLAMLASTLAISGVPLFSGFYSKDAIVAAAMHPAPGYGAAHAGGFLWSLPGILIPAAAFMTAFYMFRLIIMTFHGEPRSAGAEHAHESPWTMTVPLIVLGLLAVLGGSPWLFNGDFLGHRLWFDEIVRNPALEAGKIALGAEAPEAHGLLPLILSVAVAGGGILLAFCFYQWRIFDPARTAAALGAIHRTVYHKYWIDEFYLNAIVRPLVYRWNVFCAAFDRYVIDGFVDGVGRTAKTLAFKQGWFDKNVVDGLVNLTAFVTQVFGAIARIFQTGYLQHYVTVLAGGAAVGLVIFYWFL